MSYSCAGFPVTLQHSRMVWPRALPRRPVQRRRRRASVSSLLATTRRRRASQVFFSVDNNDRDSVRVGVGAPFMAPRARVGAGERRRRVLIRRQEFLSPLVLESCALVARIGALPTQSLTFGGLDVSARCWSIPRQVLRIKCGAPRVVVLAAVQNQFALPTCRVHINTNLLPSRLKLGLAQTQREADSPCCLAGSPSRQQLDDAKTPRISRPRQPCRLDYAAPSGSASIRLAEYAAGLTYVAAEASRCCCVCAHQYAAGGSPNSAPHKLDSPCWLVGPTQTRLASPSNSNLVGCKLDTSPPRLALVLSCRLDSPARRCCAKDAGPSVPC